MKTIFVTAGWGIIWVLSILSLQSCQRLGWRGPSSQNTLDRANVEDSYALEVQLEQQKYLEKKLEKISDHANKEYDGPDQNSELETVKANIQSLESKIKQLNADISAEADTLGTSTPRAEWGTYIQNFKTVKEKLVISEPIHFALKDGKIARVFKMDLSGSTDYQLGIVNKAFAAVKKKGAVEDEGHNDYRRYFDATIKCDNQFKMKKVVFNKTFSANEEVKFRIYEQADNSPKIVLHFGTKVKSCDMTFQDPETDDVVYGVRLVSDRKEESKLSEVKDRFETCVLPDASHLKGVEKLFLTPNYSSMTCVNEVADIKTLEDPFDGVRAKAEALIGQPLPEGFVEAANPYAPIDFSKAPKLNTVLISYLVFRHDFYGTLIARLAKWHADHGAQVRILMSDVIANKKDRIMLHGLAESSNNIKIQEFRYDSDGGGLWDHLSEFHKTLHVKLLVTLADDPKDNIVFIGGRNIHDGFVFTKTPDHSKFPELIQYGDSKGSEEGFAPWRDYEMRIRSKAFAEQIASHYMNLWQRDSQTLYVRSVNKNVVTKIPADPKYFEQAKDKAYIRHFMSIPYKDDQALEKFYIDVFDSAEKSIRMSSPYFRPTKKLGEAIERAVNRGVSISLITRIDLKGDTADIILSDVNKSGINKFLGKIKVFEYTEPGVILHSKIILVDDKVSFIGSVNLNKRSFVHDMESAVMIYSPAYNKKMHAIMDTYKNITREVTEKQKIAMWKKIIIGVFDEEF